VQHNLVILGAGNFAEEVLDLAYESGFDKVKCFVEGIDRNLCKETISNIPIVWMEEVANFDHSNILFCGIGSTKRKNLIERVLPYGLDFANIIHPSARVSSNVRIGIDVLVSVGSIISTGSIIGDHVIINRAVIIGHHVTVGDYVTISPGVNIGGRSTIGEGSYIGMGAIILDHISIGSNSIVGAGAVVTKNVPDSVQVIGIPAVVSKKL